MKKINFLNNIYYLVITCFLFIVSCTTEDISPAATLSASTTDLSEAAGTITLTVALNSTTEKLVSIPILIAGSAALNQDFSLSSAAVSITKGNSSGSITITGLQDQEIEGIETLLISLAPASNFLILGNSTVEISVLDDDADTDNDGVLDANDECPNIAGDIANNGCPFLGFLINEVLYDPASGDAGDANGDGTRDANEDEFIEFYNSGLELNLSGYTISDADAIRHTFPPGTILGVNKVLVLFGGGNPTGTFGGAIVQTASEGLINMSNSGDVVTLKDTSGNVVLTFDIEPLSNNPNESYTRNPDLTGNFEQHGNIAEANGTLFSPGTKLDGSSF